MWNSMNNFRIFLISNHLLVLNFLLGWWELNSDSRKLNCKYFFLLIYSFKLGCRVLCQAWTFPLLASHQASVTGWNLCRFYYSKKKISYFGILLSSWEFIFQIINLKAGNYQNVILNNQLSKFFMYKFTRKYLIKKFTLY